MFHANFFTVLNYFLPILDQDNDTLFFIISEGVEILMQLLLLVINGTIPINTITLIIKDS